MICFHPSPRTRAGFTLIEVLLAVAVFAIVLAAINSVFFGALRLRNKTTAAFENALPLQQALSILQRDFEGIMPSGSPFGGTFTTTTAGTENTPAFAGQRVTPDLYTTVGSVDHSARWADVQKVAYFLAVPTNNVSESAGKDLVRLVTRNLLPVSYEEAESQWLMSGLEELRLQFYDGMTWIENWDNSTTTNLPQAIKVQIIMAEDRARAGRVPMPIEIVVPVFVQAATNTLEQTGGGGP